MWIYDGEEWIREGGENETSKQEDRPRLQDRRMPELQIVPREEVERPMPAVPLSQPDVAKRRRRERNIGHA